MKRYDKVIERMKDLYRCSQFFKMDLRRLIGYKKEEWLLEIKKENSYLNFETKLSGILKKEIESCIYEVVPKKYIFSFELYNKFFNYFELFLSMENNQLIELQRESREIDNIDLLVINLAKEAGFIKEDKYELMRKKK